MHSAKRIRDQLCKIARLKFILKMNCVQDLSVTLINANGVFLQQER